MAQRTHVGVEEELCGAHQVLRTLGGAGLPRWELAPEGDAVDATRRAGGRALAGAAAGMLVGVAWLSQGVGAFLQVRWLEC
jgi:ferric-dicitrate binding protein FerR (iron transport regulator)